MEINKIIKETMVNHHKRIVAGFFIGTFVVSGIGITQSVFSAAVNDEIAITQPVEVEYFELTIDGQKIGDVPSLSAGKELLEVAKKNLENRIGYKADLDVTIAYNPKKDVDVSYTPENEVLQVLEDSMFGSIDELKVKAYVMKIGEEFTVTLANEDALKEVLEGAQSSYVQDDSMVNIELVQDPNDSLIMIPKVTVLQKEVALDRAFLTAAAAGEPLENLEANENEFLEAAVKEMTYETPVVITETFVDQSDITDVLTATQLITKENEKVKKYIIKSGDCASIIAVANNMSTVDLYAMNPGLQDNESKMQIGDELVVMVPEPELMVNSVEEVIYTEIIDRNKVYVDNPDAYIGTDSVLEPGLDGLLEVRAVITKVNGKEMDKEILEETRIAEPTTEKILRGSKALPITNATGVFQVPLVKYKLTSTYGTRWGRLHGGLDFSAPTGTAMKASDGGRVIAAGWDGGFGYRVIIDHGNGKTTLYAHASKIYVSVGQDVGKYETIAAVGSTGNSTGPHLHFEIHVGGNRVDPMKYLKF